VLKDKRSCFSTKQKVCYTAVFTVHLLSRSRILIICMYGSQLGEALQLHTVYKESYFYYKSCRKLYQVKCVTSECAMKSKVRMIKISHHSPSYIRKNIICLLLLALLLVLHTCNNTDGMIFSSIVFYYGDT